MTQTNYAPYFRNGLLYIPRETAQLIHITGLDADLATDATNGLRLDDDSQKIAQLNLQLQELIAGLDDQPAIQAQLSSSEVQFIFSSIEESEDIVSV